MNKLSRIEEEKTDHRTNDSLFIADIRRKIRPYVLHAANCLNMHIKDWSTVRLENERRRAANVPCTVTTPK